jgi:hypothetical protein
MKLVLKPGPGGCLFYGSIVAKTIKLPSSFLSLKGAHVHGCICQKIILEVGNFTSFEGGVVELTNISPNCLKGSHSFSRILAK